MKILWHEVWASFDKWALSGSSESAHAVIERLVEKYTEKPADISTLQKVALGNASADVIGFSGVNIDKAHDAYYDAIKHSGMLPPY